MFDVQQDHRGFRWSFKTGLHQVVFVEPGVKITGANYRDVVLMQKLQPVIRQISGNIRSSFSQTELHHTMPERQYLHPLHTQVVAAEINPPPASSADTAVHASAHIPTTVPTIPLVELLPPVPTRVIELPQARPVRNCRHYCTVPCTLSSTFCTCHTDLPPPAHSHYTRAPMHTYSNIPTGTASESYLNVLVLSTATITTSTASHPQDYYNWEQSIVEQVLRGHTSASAALQPAAASTADASKREPVAATLAPVTSVVPAAPSTAASVLSGAIASAVPLAATPAPVVFKQLQQPRTYNGSTNWRDYRAHFERVCKVNGWNTAQDRAQTLNLALEGLEGPAADVLKDVDESAPNAYGNRQVVGLDTLTPPGMQ